MSDYNGWANKETWLVNLWLGDYFDSMKEDGVEITADLIEETIDELMTPELEGFQLDMWNCAIGSVDYYELAKHYEEEGK